MDSKRKDIAISNAFCVEVLHNFIVILIIIYLGLVYKGGISGIVASRFPAPKPMSAQKRLLNRVFFKKKKSSFYNFLKVFRKFKIFCHV